MFNELETDIVAVACEGCLACFCAAMSAGWCWALVHALRASCEEPRVSIARVCSVKTRSLARRTFPALVVACTLHTSACTHAHSAGFAFYTVLKTQCAAEQEITSWHDLDCIHRHLHGNPTCIQHHIAHDHEVRVGSTTPQLKPPDVAKSMIDHQAELVSQVLSPTCTTRTTL